MGGSRSAASYLAGYSRSIFTNIAGETEDLTHCILEYKMATMKICHLIDLKKQKQSIFKKISIVVEANRLAQISSPTLYKPTGRSVP